jgi:hypothetical protein
MTSALVYFVPYLDGDWLGYGPLDPVMNFGLLPANRKEIHANLLTAVSFWRERTGGKMVFGAHSGTYCRDLFYEDDTIALYRDLVVEGGEFAVHPHEERVNAGHIIGDLDHMRYIITWKRQQLVDAGITPTALRLPYNGYVPGLTKIAQDNGLLVDLSAATNFVNPYWSSDWQGAPASAWRLDHSDHRNAEGDKKSPVLEIPIGWDGVEPKSGHYLFNEQVPLERLLAIWDAIAERGRREGPQMVYILSHLHAMAKPDLSDRLTRLIEHAHANGGIAVAPSEAYRVHASFAAH